MQQRIEKSNREGEKKGRENFYKKAKLAEQNVLKEKQ